MRPMSQHPERVYAYTKDDYLSHTSDVVYLQRRLRVYLQRRREREARKKQGRQVKSWLNGTGRLMLAKDATSGGGDNATSITPSAVAMRATRYAPAPAPVPVRGDLSGQQQQEEQAEEEAVLDPFEEPWPELARPVAESGAVGGEELDGSNCMEAYVRACDAEGSGYAGRLLEQMDAGPLRLLEELVDLRHYHLGPQGGRAVAACLERNTEILQLDLGDTGLGVEGGQALMEAIGAQRNTAAAQHGLKSLKLCDNGIFGDSPLRDKAGAARLQLLTDRALLSMAEAVGVDEDELAATLQKSARGRAAQQLKPRLDGPFQALKAGQRLGRRLLDAETTRGLDMLHTDSPDPAVRVRQRHLWHLRRLQQYQAAAAAKGEEVPTVDSVAMQQQISADEAVVVAAAQRRLHCTIRGVRGFGRGGGGGGDTVPCAGDGVDGTARRDLFVSLCLEGLGVVGAVAGASTLVIRASTLQRLGGGVTGLACLYVPRNFPGPLSEVLQTDDAVRLHTEPKRTTTIDGGGAAEARWGGGEGELLEFTFSQHADVGSVPTLRVAVVDDDLIAEAVDSQGQGSSSSSSGGGGAEQQKLSEQVWLLYDEIGSARLVNLAQGSVGHEYVDEPYQRECWVKVYRGGAEHPDAESG
jgi:hypothetical protein